MKAIHKINSKRTQSWHRISNRVMEVLSFNIFISKMLFLIKCKVRLLSLRQRILRKISVIILNNQLLIIAISYLLLTMIISLVLHWKIQQAREIYEDYFKGITARKHLWKLNQITLNAPMVNQVIKK